MTKPHQLDDEELADAVDVFAQSHNDLTDDMGALLAEAARRLRRGGGVTIRDSSAGGDIIASAVSHRPMADLARRVREYQERKTGN